MSSYAYSRVDEFDDDAKTKPNKYLDDLDDNDTLFLKCRWQSFAGICLLVSVVGTGYAFGIMASLLENNLRYSQTQLDTLASIGNTGMYMSLMCGVLVEKYGFKKVISTGSCMIFVGFLYLYLAVSEYIPSSLYTVSAFYFLSQIGTSFHISTCVTLSVQLFPPQSRGMSIGLCKGYFALSSAVLADIAGGYFKQVPSLYLLFVSIFIPITGKFTQRGKHQ